MIPQPTDDTAGTVGSILTGIRNSAAVGVIGHRAVGLLLTHDAANLRTFYRSRVGISGDICSGQADDTTAYTGGRHRTVVHTVGNVHLLASLSVVSRTHNTTGIAVICGHNRRVGAIAHRSAGLDAADHTANALSAADCAAQHLHTGHNAAIDDTAHCRAHIVLAVDGHTGELHILDRTAIQHTDKAHILIVAGGDSQSGDGIALTVKGALKRLGLSTYRRPIAGKCNIFQQFHRAAALGCVQCIRQRRIRRSRAVLRGLRHIFVRPRGGGDAKGHDQRQNGC